MLDIIAIGDAFQRQCKANVMGTVSKEKISLIDQTMQKSKGYLLANI